MRARGLLKQALERADPGPLEARILVSLAHVESELGSRSEGLKLCDDALAVPDLDPHLIGLIQSQRALLLGRSGMVDDALEAFGAALDLLDAGDPVPRMHLHINRGNVQMMRGDGVRASRDFERAVELADRAGLEIPKAKAESNLGYARLLVGDLVSALRMMEAAQPTLSALSEVSAAVCEQDRAEALAASGLATEAEAALTEAARAFGSRKLRQQQAEAELILARLLAFDHPADAAKVARRASRRFASRGSAGWALRADAVAADAELSTGIRRERALVAAGEVVAQLHSHGHQQEALLLHLRMAIVEADLGHVAAAEEQLTQTRVTGRSPLQARLMSREARAAVARARGRRGTAVGHLRRGLDDLHSWQSSFGSLDLQSSVVMHGQGLAIQGLSLAIEDGRPAVVFEWSERARALASRVTPVRLPADAEAADELAELRRLQSEISAAEASGALTRSLLAEADAVREHIRQRSWYGEGSGLVTEPAVLDEVAAVLDRAGGALVSYLVIDGRLHALVVAGEVPHVVDLGPFADVKVFLDGMQADLDMAAARLPAVMRQSVLASLDQRLALLASVIVAPVAELIGDRALVVVPAGSLTGVPWTLLPGLKGRPLTVPRSATMWAAAEAGSFTASRAGFVAGPRVDRAFEEVERAMRAWPAASMLVGDEAVAPDVSRLAEGVDVFHVAAHGRHSADNPLFSGVELVDGPWFGYDIDQLGGIPSTVILSACEVGRSSIRWGEETIGMTVAWLHAGARCVVASPALVNDDAACEVLAATHRRLAAGDEPAYALASATSEVATPSPAPFICFGSGF